MAVVIAGANTRLDTTDPLGVFNFNSSVITKVTSTSVSTRYTPSGETWQIFGHGFSNNPSVLASSTITGFVHNGPGTTLTVSGLSVIFGDVALYLNSYDAAGLSAFLFSGDDTITGATLNDHLVGYGGNDTIQGNGGDDIIDGGAGNNSLNGGGDIDTVSFASATSAVVVSLALVGQQNTGGGGLDTLSNFENVSGSAFDDLFIGTTGDNVFSGGAGLDTVSYANATSAVTVSLIEYTPIAQQQNTGGGGHDTLISIEGVIGTDYDDVFTAGFQPNQKFDGGAGFDILNLAGFVERSAVVFLSGASNGGLIVNNIEGLVGGNLADTFTGDAADNFLSGGGGGDILNGGWGADILDGGTGIDTASYEDATAGVNVSLLVSGAQDTGGGGVDTLISIENLTGSQYGDTLTGLNDNYFYTIIGNAGADTIIGGDGYDTLFSDAASLTPLGSYYGLDIGAEQDTLIGGAGNDTFYAGYGDNIDGGSNPFSYQGGDTLYISFQGAMQGVTADFSMATQVIGGGTITGVELVAFVQGSNFDDTITLNDTVGANPVVYGMDGDDTLSAGYYTIKLYGGDGNDTVDGRNSQYLQIIDGGGGDDHLIGNNFDNVLNGGSGTNIIDGGSGSDTVSYAGNVVGGVALSLQDDNGSSVGEGIVDTYISIENAIGSAFNDFLGGSAGANSLNGGAGDDRIWGRGGDDVINGGDGNDVLIGESGYNLPQGWDAVSTGNDTIYGGDGNDLIIGGLGNDMLFGGDGDDRLFNGIVSADNINGWAYYTSPHNTGYDVIDGGAGHDEAYLNYADRSEGITFTLSVPNITSQVMVGGAVQGSVVNVEWVQFIGGSGNDVITATGSLYGNDGDDVLTVTSGTSQLYGGAGDDILIAGSADGDELQGGAGADQLNGGTGIDDNISYTQSGAAVTVDLMVGVSHGGDAEGDTFTGIEGIIGTAYADTLSGDDGANRLYGRSGDDILTGRGGNDTLNGETGHDQMFGGAGNDVLYGGDDADLLYGGDDADFLDGGIGDDLLDGGDGSDTVRYAESGGGVTADLSLSGPQSVDGGQGADTFVSIENLTGSNYADILTGDGGSNILTGGSGNDTLNGGGGDDRLDGGLGDDTLDGGAGNDLYLVDSANDVASESDANGGVDTVELSVSFTLGANIENLTLTGASSINGTGNALANIFIGNSVNNVLAGLGGDDVYYVGPGDAVVEASSDGNDTVVSAFTFTLGDNVENLTLIGADAINGTGNELANILIGNSAPNVLSGLGGDDTLIGGNGGDTLNGGAGDDTYYVGAGDTVVEVANGGADTLLSDATYTLGANVENLTLTGVAAISGTGNALGNVLTGNSGANVLTGLAGDDSYYVGAGDTVVEAANGGTDTVFADFSFTLGANVENLTLTGSANIDGTGNALANILTGNAGINTLSGGAGNDNYYVGAGDTIVEMAGKTGGVDTVFADATFTLTDPLLENLTLTGLANLNGTGNALANVITGNEGDNVLTGLAGNDTLNGGAGNDTLDGGAGNDVMTGGLGDDIYFIDSAKDSVIELSGIGSGVDTIFSSITYALNTNALANVENLTLTGTSALNAAGNALNNILTGNSADNVLKGGAGDDALDGGLGNDTADYAAATAGIIVDLNLSTPQAIGGGEGSDTLLSIERVIGSNFADTLTGDANANALTGNAGNDFLDGGAGADTLNGGAGDDTYVVDDIGDTLTDLSKKGGIDSVRASVSFTLGAVFENLTLTGTDNIDGNGNALANTLIGNAGANVLSGMNGADTYIVGDGDSVIEVAGKKGGNRSGAILSYVRAGRLYRKPHPDGERRDRRHRQWARQCAHRQ